MPRMRNNWRRLLAFFAKHVGSYYFVEVEELRAPDAIPLARFRIIVRALTVASAIQAGYNYCRTKKGEDGKEYALSSIHKI